MRRVVATIGLWSAALLTAPDAVRAQTNLETNAGVQFNFLTPGAGNLGMGSAFIALAFDATAAYTNPAGLAQVVRPEAWVEARSWRYTHLYTDRGRLVGPHTGVGADDTTGLKPLRPIRSVFKMQQRKLQHICWRPHPSTTGEEFWTADREQLLARQAHSFEA